MNFKKTKNVGLAKTAFAATLSAFAILIVFQCCTPAKMVRIYAAWIVTGMDGKHLWASFVGEDLQGKTMDAIPRLFSVDHPASLSISVSVFELRPVNAFIMCATGMNDFKPMQRIGSSPHFSFPHFDDSFFASFIVGECGRKVKKVCLSDKAWRVP